MDILYMNIDTLKFIASSDDTVQFCGLDIKLAEKFKKQFAEKQKFETTFDSIFSLASNPDLLTNKLDFFTKKTGKMCKRQFGTFDEEKYLKYFIENRLKFLEDSEQVEIKRTGFDAYRYLMAYNDDILHMYKGHDNFSKLQKAGLYFIEIGNEEKELDYIKYVASYDDLVLDVVNSKKKDESPWEDWINKKGKEHYESKGKNEILNSDRPLNEFFDSTKYVATYPSAANVFKDDNGVIDDKKTAIGYITVGAISGFIRNGFNPYVFLANYPELISEDIYVDKEINDMKVAKLWLEKYDDTKMNLTRFNVKDHLKKKGINDDVEIDGFKDFVLDKVKEYQKDSKQPSCFSCFRRSN